MPAEKQKWNRAISEDSDFFDDGKVYGQWATFYTTGVTLWVRYGGQIARSDHRGSAFVIAIRVAA